jgi:hypothetical protein
MNVIDLSHFASTLYDYEPQAAMEAWNIPISDQVMSPSMRRIKARSMA